jgi:hypothetical protein
MDDLHKRRMAHNETRFRHANAKITTSLDELVEQEHAPQYTLVCECALGDCTEMVQLVADEYQVVRSNPLWFAVRPEHIVEELEHVVARTDRFWTIEKDGVGAQVAREDDRDPQG